MTYYRLRCLQNGNYMGTGYNTESVAELCEDYASYKSNDWDEGDIVEGEETMEEVWAKMSDEEKLNFIRDDEFEIEESEVPFEELD